MMNEKEEMEFLNLDCYPGISCPVVVTEDGELFQMFDIDLE